MVLSPLAADHVNRPRNAGRLSDPTHEGVGGVPGDGPYVRLTFRVAGGTIAAAGYECNGCPSSIAASSIALQALIGRTPEQALRMDSQDLLRIIGGLPEGKEGCADLAVKAVQSAFLTQAV